MPITYKWKIEQMDSHLEVDGKNDVVFHVHWRYIANDGKNEESLYGSIGLMLDQNVNFIPYPDLKLENVIKWVEDTLGDEYILEMNKILSDRILSKINPSVLTIPNPWDK